MRSADIIKTYIEGHYSRHGIYPFEILITKKQMLEVFPNYKITHPRNYISYIHNGEKIYIILIDDDKLLESISDFINDYEAIYGNPPLEINLTRKQIEEIRIYTFLTKEEGSNLFTYKGVNILELEPTYEEPNSMEIQGYVPRKSLDAYQKGYTRSIQITKIPIELSDVKVNMVYEDIKLNFQYFKENLIPLQTMLKDKNDNIKLYVGFTSDNKLVTRDEYEVVEMWSEDDLANWQVT